MADVIDSFIGQLDDIIEFYYGNRSDIIQYQANFITRAMAAIERIAGPDSVYAKQAYRYIEKYQSNQSSATANLVGVMQALRNDVAGGFLKSVRELVHGELFSDFLDMAAFLLGEGYKDAAAVMGGGVLESHLRQLCLKHGIDLEVTLGNDSRVKKTNQLNADLAKQKVYSLLDQKQVTAWLDLRNKAAHAKYGEYTKEQVVLMLQGIRNFIARCPA
jgi:hypothetical protein